MAALAFTPRLLVAYARAATLLAVAASLLLAFLSAWAGEVDARDPVRHTLTLDDGRERSYLVYSPEPGSRRPGDVALVLHGSGGNAARIRALTARRFETLADEHRFLVLYPEGFEGNWNACRRPAPFSANRLNVDDVAFLRALVRRHAGSDGRVLAFGFSGGGHMALRLALEAPETVDAVAVVGANLPQAEDNDCRPAEGRALPAVLLINGTADPINPFDGGDVVLPPELGGLILGRVLSSSETARLLAERAGYRGGFSTEAGKEVDGNPATAITWARWRAANMPEVALVTVIGGGHTIPQPGTAYPVLLGPHSADIDAPREAWAFVQRAAPAHLATRPRRPGHRFPFPLRRSVWPCDTCRTGNANQRCTKMDRRQFCRATLGSSLFAYAYLTGCERAPTGAAKADTGIPAVSLSGAEIELEKAAVNELKDALSGELLLSGHPGYDSARKIWNGMHDKHPALIAQCRDARDISQAVTFARERELLVAVRGGGHSWPGLSVCDGGMMLDLSVMNTVDVDPEKRRAYAKGGALLNALDTASRKHGLITTAGVVSHTGVGGFTLGGGFGRLNRKFGLAVDNLRGAEIVTADGQIRQVSAEQEPDLFWAIRGGGGNFGVVSQFEYEVYPFPLEVYSGNVVFPIADARKVLEFYAEWYADLSDDMYAGPAMLTLPDGTSVLVMEIVYAGDPAEGEKVLAPLLKVATPLENGVGMNDYMMMQTQEDATFAHGIRSYAKSGMAKEITPELVDALVESFVPDPRLAFFTHTAGGAVKRVDELATAFPHRNAETMLIVAGGWTDPEHDAEARAKAREWFAQLEPFTGGYYSNIEFDGPAADENYGPAYPRLAEIKARYDATNLFRLNSNIQPATA